MTSVSMHSDLVHVKCNLCQSDDAKYICHTNSVPLVRCRQCGLYYLNPRPSTGALHELYASSYYPPTTDLKKRTEELWGPEITWTWASMDMFSDITQHCRRWKPAGRVLDVGCGYGFFLQLMAKNGYSAQGVDLSELATRYAKDELDLDVLNIGLHEARFADRSFDIVTMNGVAEHLEDPLDTFKEVNRILDLNGLFVITAPNALFGLPLIYAHKVLRGDMVLTSTIKTAIFEAPWHLYFFSPTTLGKLLVKAGFEIVSVYNGVPIKNPSKGMEFIKQLSWRLANMVSFISGGSILIGNSIAMYARKKS